MVGDITPGVIEFLAHHIRNPDPDLLESMVTIARHVGQFIEPRQSEVNPRRSEHELSDFFENAAIGLHWVEPDGTILRANHARGSRDARLFARGIRRPQQR
ncbi:MAG: hypothetical protein ABI777_03815 [Betaproteobacteria bacterium]